jgi:hypothetical protein
MNMQQLITDDGCSTASIIIYLSLTLYVAISLQFNTFIVNLFFKLMLVDIVHKGGEKEGKNIGDIIGETAEVYLAGDTFLVSSN